MLITWYRLTACLGLSASLTKRTLSGIASAIGWVEEQTDNITPEGSLAYQARTARFCGAPVPATPAPGAAPRQIYNQSRTDHQQWPVLPKRLDMMCVASGSALSIATFGLFPLAGLDVSPVANKPTSQSQVAILKVFRAALCNGFWQNILSHVAGSPESAATHDATSFGRASGLSLIATTVHLIAGDNDT